MGAMLESRPERVDSDSETASMQVSDTAHLKYSWGRGTDPARAGNVGTGGAFALERDGNFKGVDVPVLAPAQSRCLVGEVVVGFGK